MPNDIEYQESQAGANNFNGYINNVLYRKQTLLRERFNEKKQQNKINAVGVEDKFKNYLMYYIALETAE